MENKIDQLRDFLTDLIMNKSKPTVVRNEDTDNLSEAALKSVADEWPVEDGDPEKDKDGASSIFI